MLSFQCRARSTGVPGLGQPGGMEEAICMQVSAVFILLEFVRLIEALSLYHT